MTMHTKPNFSVRAITGISLFACLALHPVLGQNADKPFTAKVQPFVDSKALTGAVVLLANKDRVLDVEAIGYADRVAGKPMQADDLFWIASVTKPFTKAAILILADEGKVNLDDPVEKYLPEFKGQQVIGADGTLKPPSHPFTIKEAMEHKAGLPMFSKKEIALKQIDTLPLKDAVRTYAAEPLIYDPGSKTAYSNAGMNTVGRVVEVVSGMPYEQFLSERLFTPLGMKDTTFWPAGEQLNRIAVGTRLDPKKGPVPVSWGLLSYPLDNKAKRYPIPAGGLFSTAEDLAKFGQLALNDGMCNGKRIMSDKAVTEAGFTMAGMSGVQLAVDRKKGTVLVWMVQGGDKTALQSVMDVAKGASTK
jgi:CubicO group peptidase (beta-lactamase class C family)